MDHFLYLWKFILLKHLLIFHIDCLSLFILIFLFIVRNLFINFIIIIFKCIVINLFSYYIIIFLFLLNPLRCLVIFKCRSGCPLWVVWFFLPRRLVFMFWLLIYLLLWCYYYTFFYPLLTDNVEWSSSGWVLDSL